jgi:hypothetical protein
VQAPDVHLTLLHEPFAEHSIVQDRPPLHVMPPQPLVLEHRTWQSVLSGHVTLGQPVGALQMKMHAVPFGAHVPPAAAHVWGLHLSSGVTGASTPLSDVSVAFGESVASPSELAASPASAVGGTLSSISRSVPHAVIATTAKELMAAPIPSFTRAS